ncbi:hypothetical protein HY448_01680 [Candidatus Pacearchaeota archaeon]|nr:hypothetical protein [Candidatus Pacearchaeota archaeon]
MEVSHEQFVRLIFKEPHQILLISSSGGGKTTTGENLIEESYDRGAFIVSPFDPKEELELAFAMFEPEKAYHLKELAKIGKEKSKKRVRIHHPFTFNLPRHEKLYPMELYTFAMNEIGRDEISFITESQSDLDIVRSMVNATNELKKDDSLFDFMKIIEKKTKAIKRMVAGKEIAMPDPSNFFLKTGSTGTSKTIGDISSYFQPFLIDYCVAPENFFLNLDIKEIFRDRESYHVFSTRFIKDEKIKYFVALKILNLLYENRKYCNHPMVIYMPEVSSLLPYREKGYKEFLAMSLAPKILKFRSRGAGGTSTIMESQNWWNIFDKVRGGATRTLFGQLGDAQDIERLSKALKWKADTVQLIKGLRKGEFIIQGMENKYGSFRLFMPSHMHKEIDYTFENMFRRHYPELLVKYSEIIAKVQEEIKIQREKVRKEAQEEYLHSKKFIEEKQKSLQEKRNQSQELEQTQEKLKDVKLKEKERMQEECLRLYAEGKKYREIGRELKLDHKTVKNYIIEAQKRKTENISPTPIL